MKIIAHRGWSSGKNENTLKAFQKAVDNNLDGVEFDVRWSINKQNLIISHDPENLGPRDLNNKALGLEEGLKFLADKNLELWIELKECDERLFSRLIDLLKKNNLIQKSLVFAFREVAESFNWQNREVQLGIIVEYPWKIKGNIRKYNPDSILMGWDDRWWTKSVFKFLWSVFSFDKLSKKYPNIKFVAGVVKNNSDHDWISRQKGLYSCTADKPFEWGN